MGILTQEEIEEFVVACWKIWKMRNEFIFKDIFQHPLKLVREAKLLLGEIRQLPTSYRNNISKHSIFVEWQAPPRGTFKLNWDAAVDKTHCLVGIGAIVHDWKGSVKTTLRMQKTL